VRALGTSILYLLALNALACALLAWGRATPMALAGWAVALAVALLLGERLGEAFEVIDARRRDRMAVFLGTLQLSVLVLGLVLAVGSPTPGLLRFLTNLLSGFMLLVLGLARLTPQPRGVLGHAVALVALAGLHGEALGAWAAGATLALVGLYVGLDHHAQLIAAHRLELGPHTARALLLTARVVLPVALAVGLGVYSAAPQPRLSPLPEAVDDGYRPLKEKPERELDRRALRAMVLAGLVGAVAVYFVGRWIVRSKPGERKSIETPESLRGALEAIRPERAQSRGLPHYGGHRGRIVRAYLGLLRGAERAGFPKRPAETPDEFAAALAEPREPLVAATSAFVLARYGPLGVGEADLASAEQGAAAVLDHLRRRPPPRRRDTVKDAGTRA
jgi:MFS family permease